MTLSEIERKFIQFQLQDPLFTVEEIEYLVNKERNGEDKMTLEEVEFYLEATKERAKLQKAIDDKKSRRKAGALITDMNCLIADLREMITELKKEEGSNKTIVQTIKELRLSIMDIARLAGELQKQQDVKISLHYVPIHKIEEYVQQRLKEISEKKQKKKTDDEAIEGEILEEAAN